MRIGPYAFSGVSPLASVSLFNVDFYEINECETSTSIYPFGTRTVKKENVQWTYVLLEKGYHQSSQIPVYKEKMKKVEQTNLTAYNYVLGRISPALLAKPAGRRFFNNNYDSLLLFRAIIISIQCWCGTPPLLQSNTTSSILWKYQS